VDLRCVDAGNEDVVVVGHRERNRQHDRRILDRRIRARAIHQRVEEGCMLRGVELHSAETRLDPHQAVGIVPEMNGLNLLHTAHEQPRANEQHHRQRGLNDEKRRSESRPLAGAIAWSGLERGGDIGTAGLKNWRKPCEQARHQRAQCGECQHTPVGERVFPFDLRHQRGAQYLTAPLRDRHTRSGAEESQQATLDEKLTGETRPAHAECDAHGDLAPPLERPSQKKIADVRAGDEQHDRRNAEKQRRDFGVGRRRRPALVEHRANDRARLRDVDRCRPRR
jgi:hypothetical protein